MCWPVLAVLCVILVPKLLFGNEDDEDRKPSPYPPTKVDPVVEKIHGVEVVDPYRWLENGTSPAVKAWTDQENAFTRSVLDKLPERDKIHARLNQLLDIGSLSAPAPAKGKYFYTKREGKQNQPILYVREGLHGKDRVLLDANALDKEGTTALDWWFPSDDGSLVAYGLSANGSEQSTLRVREVATGKDRADVIGRTRACSLAWTPDAGGFYYTRYPAEGEVPKGDEKYHRRVFFHPLGADPAKIGKSSGPTGPRRTGPTSRCRRTAAGWSSPRKQGWAKTEVYFADLHAKDDAKWPAFQPLVEKVDARRSASKPATTASTSTPTRKARVTASSRSIHSSRPAKSGRKSSPKVRTYSKPSPPWETCWSPSTWKRRRRVCGCSTKAGKFLQDVPLPTLGSVSGLGAEWDGDELLFGFQSFTAPQTVYRLDLKKPAEAKPELWGKVEADVDFSQFEVEQVTYPSKDGTPITMFLAHGKGQKPDGQQADAAVRLRRLQRQPDADVLGEPVPVPGAGRPAGDRQPARRRRVRRGLAPGRHARQEAERLRRLHRRGRVADRARSTPSRDRLAIQGGSNGGLLMGAALTQRPDLFRAVVCQVPLLDMLRYHQFQIARLWIPEYGSSDDPEQFKWLYAYSPYHHVKDGVAYPAVLLEAAESDSRVDPLHARKMAARLQAATSSDPAEKPVLLRLETKAGHGQGKPRGKLVEELTDVWSFVFWQLGMKM